MLKKWKGKDWYNILAPKMFGEIFLYETPSTDNSYLVGRTVEATVSQLTSDKTRGHIKVLFKIDDIKEKTAYTSFHGLVCNQEYIYRNVRSGLQKMECIDTVDTNDGWKLQITTSMILNKKSETMIQKKARKFSIDFLKDNASKSNLEDFIKNIVTGVYQKKMKKNGSRIYPVRFLEIGKIEVVHQGAKDTQTDSQNPTDKLK